MYMDPASECGLPRVCRVKKFRGTNPPDTASLSLYRGTTPCRDLNGRPLPRFRAGLGWTGLSADSLLLHGGLPSPFALFEGPRNNRGTPAPLTRTHLFRGTKP